MANVAYIRVSSISQNVDRQDFKGIEIDKTFEDKASGKNKERPALQQMLDYIRDNDNVYVHSIDRLARSLVDLNNIVDEIKSKGASIHFVKESLSFDAIKSDHTSELMFNILGSFAQFERQILKERQAEGIAKAKAKGKYKGREKSLTDFQEQELYDEVMNLDMFTGKTKEDIAKSYGISRQTLYRVVKRLHESRKTEVL